MTREELNLHKQNTIDKAFSKEQRKKFVLTMLKLLVIVIILFLAFYFYTKYISNGKIIVKEERVINSKIPDEFNGVKIIQFSDLKFGTTMDMDNVKDLVSLINSRKPDLVLFTGNLISETYDISPKEQEKLITLFNNIDCKLGKYAVYGYEDDEAFRTILNQSDFTILSNSYELIYKYNDQPLLLIGEDSMLDDRIDINKSFEYKKANSNIYTIVMTNETNPIDDIVTNQPDLILAGGNLNGSVRIPVFGGLVPKAGSNKYLNPYYKLGDCDVYVSSGLGTDGIGFRINNYPSISLFRLSNKKI